MKILGMLLIAMLISSEGYFIEYGNESGGEDWQVVNDDLMGGQSTS